MSGSKAFEVAFSVDVVLLSLVDGELHVALMPRGTGSAEPYPGVLALPGGTVDRDGDADTDVTVRRVLLQRCGIAAAPYFEQLRLFAGRERDPRGWSASMAHVSLVSPELLAGAAPGLRWVPVSQARGLAFDHDEMVREAVARVSNKATYSTLPLHLMPAEFTMAELQAVYESILGGVIEDRRTFRRIMLSTGVVEATSRKRLSGKVGKPGELYRVVPRHGVVLLPGPLARYVAARTGVETGGGE